MEQTELDYNDRSKKTDQFSREDLIKQNEILESELTRAIKEIYRLKYQNLTDEQLNMVLAEHLNELRNDMYGASSERYKKPENKPKKPESPAPRVRKPSERYPNVVIREIPIKFDQAPGCGVCGEEMQDSGMTEDSEQLTLTPKKFEILKYMRSIYRCKCQSCMKTAPTPPRIVDGSSYSDEMILDVALSKYCDLIPIERYVQMAARSGLMGLPPHSLIDLTHKFAAFVKPVYDLIKAGILEARVLNADETPHKMLEGSDKKSWYLWGFSTPSLCFLECHDTRSGDVASEILLSSRCEVLVTDVYSGYGKAIRLANVERLKAGKNFIKNGNCNSHARRYFFKIRDKYPEASFYLDQYHESYQLNSGSKGKPPDEILKTREKMRPYFEVMRSRALEEIPRYFKGNKYYKALNYFMENYDALTLCLEDPEVPIDNNAQERLLRSHVVGRKTWYGTHSELGAETAAVLFSIVETCKLIHVNPREYFKNLVQDLLQELR